MVKISELKKTGYFDGLKDEELASIAARVISKRYEKGEIIVIEGSGCRSLHIVKSGRIKVFLSSAEGREHILYYVRKGDSFCDVSIFDKDSNILSASASVASEVYMLREIDMKSLMPRIPELSVLLLRKLARKSRKFIEMVEDLSFKNVPARLARILVDITEDEGVVEGNGAVLKRNITLYEMASMVGTVREVVTRSLQKLEKMGLLVIDRKKIEITDLVKLKTLAGVR